MFLFKNKKSFKIWIIGFTVIVIFCVAGIIFRQKHKEQVLWRNFGNNLQNINYKYYDSDVVTSLDKKKIWKPTEENFKDIYKYVYGDSLVPWQKIDGTDMSPFVDVLDKDGNIILKENGKPKKQRIGLIPHWEEEYNRAVERGRLQGDVIRALRDGVRNNEVNADSINIKNVSNKMSLLKNNKVGFWQYIIKQVLAAVEFSDAFTVSSDTAVESHSPDTGTGWTEIIDVGTCALYIYNNFLGDSYDAIYASTSGSSGGCGSSEGSLVETDDTMSTANYDVSVKQDNGDKYDDKNILACRIQDANNMYVVLWNEDDADLYIKNSGTWSTIDTGTSGIADGSTVTLKCQGTTISVEDDGVEILSATNSVHTSAGKAGVGMGAIINSGDDVSNQRIDDFSVDVTVASNSTPTITSVSDSPDPVTVGADISFSVDWNDADAGENIKIKICKTDSLTSQNCDGGFWATSTSFTTSDPEAPDYTVQAGDEGSQNYYAFVCDDSAACSGSTSGSFVVAPTVTSVVDTPDPIGVGSEIIFSVDWNDGDSGEMVVAIICKGSGITTSTAVCSDGQWAKSSVYTNRDPENKVVYTTVAADKNNTRNYWAFICDDGNACSNGTAGTFTVENQRPDAPIGLLVEGNEVGNAKNITDTTPEFKMIYKDSNDEGDVAVSYCIEVDTQSDFAGTNMWVSDSANCYTGSSMGVNINEGDYTIEFSYAGSTLSMDGTVYYWRVWLWDDEERSATSTTGWFNMASNINGAGVRIRGGTRFNGGVRLK